MVFTRTPAYSPRVLSAIHSAIGPSANPGQLHAATMLSRLDPSVARLSMEGFEGRHLETERKVSQVKAAIGSLPWYSAVRERSWLLAQRLFPDPFPDVKGVFLHGPPGAGKRLILDAFEASSETKSVMQRTTFQSLTCSVHERLRVIRKEHRSEDPTETLTTRLAREHRILLTVVDHELSLSQPRAKRASQ